MAPNTTSSKQTSFKHGLNHEKPQDKSFSQKGREVFTKINPFKNRKPHYTDSEQKSLKAIDNAGYLPDPIKESEDEDLENITPEKSLERIYSRNYKLKNFSH